MDEKGERASESLNTGLSGSIVHIAAFDPKAAVRHGGVRRTEQLVSLVGADKLLFIQARYQCLKGGGLFISSAVCSRFGVRLRGRACFAQPLPLGISKRGSTSCELTRTSPDFSWKCVMG